MLRGGIIGLRTDPRLLDALVERWFGELSRQCIRRGAFLSVEDLQKAIREFLDAWNENPKPFVWTATVQSIMEKLSRCRMLSFSDCRRARNPSENWCFSVKGQCG